MTQRFDYYHDSEIEDRNYQQLRFWYEGGVNSGRRKLPRELSDLIDDKYLRGQRKREQVVQYLLCKRFFALCAGRGLHCPVKELPGAISKFLRSSRQEKLEARAGLRFPVEELNRDSLRQDGSPCYSEEYCQVSLLCVLAALYLWRCNFSDANNPVLGRSMRGAADSVPHSAQLVFIDESRASPRPCGNTLALAGVPAWTPQEGGLASELRDLGARSLTESDGSEIYFLRRAVVRLTSREDYLDQVDFLREWTTTLAKVLVVLSGTSDKHDHGNITVVYERNIPPGFWESLLE